MRLQLHLTPIQQPSFIPMNYQYPLAAAIYKILAGIDPQYATWLHDQGYESAKGRAMKLFVFSKLFIPQVRPRGNVLEIQTREPCGLYISSPMLNNFIQSLVLGLFAHQEITIANQEVAGHFLVEAIYQLPNPDFAVLLRSTPDGWLPFRSLSPITLSTKEDYQGSLSIHYLRPDDPRLSEAIRHNLEDKYAIIHQDVPQDDHLEFRLDQDYITQRGGYKRISKLIWIREGDKTRETKIPSFVAPLKLKGSEELIACAYECGLGEKNSLGFGMIERDDPDFKQNEW